MTAYYNENDPYVAEWLRNLITEGHIARGDVDDRDIKEVRVDDLKKYKQCHFFAGIGGWSYALRKAGWEDDRPVWTGSCPCQPFSLAGKQKGFKDERHLWPVYFNLIKILRPSTIYGEQVASATEWLRLVRSDLEDVDYAVGTIPIQAASAGAYHLRDRYWFVANDGGGRCNGASKRKVEFEGRTKTIGTSNSGLDVANGHVEGSQGRELLSQCTGKRASRTSGMGHSTSKRGERIENPARSDGRDGTQDTGYIVCADGKARRIEPGIRLLAHGVPARVGKLRAFGNAIDPRPAEAFIRATM